MKNILSLGLWSHVASISIGGDTPGVFPSVTKTWTIRVGRKAETHLKPRQLLHALKKLGEKIHSSDCKVESGTALLQKKGMKSQ